MTLRELNYTLGAQWVQARCVAKIAEHEISAALQALAHTAAIAQTDCAVEGLFPDSDLQVLLSQDLDCKDKTPPPLPAKVELSAMRAIGEAIDRGMKDSNTRIMSLNVDGYGEIVVFHPEVRDTVLLGARTTVLSA